ncbi:MAG: hypothetical protein JWM16_6300 [Verrucomicrobiales bacterium]|nr:hypothetical protein [Verrucomicrobiales bacterium]
MRIKLMMMAAAAIAAGLFCGCAGTANPYKVEKIQGRKIGEVRYTGYETLEAALRKKYKDDMDFQVEKKLLPRGGNLYVLDKKYWTKNPLAYAEVSDGVHKGKCDEAEIKNTTLSDSPKAPMSPGSNVLVPVGPQIKFLDKTKTEIDCKLDVSLHFPSTIYFIAMNFDTLATYRIVKADSL